MNRVTGSCKSTLGAIAIVVGMLVLAAGCMTTTQETDQTLPPYASISDEGRDPASAPTPAPTSSGDSGGVMSGIGNAIAWPFQVIGQGFGLNSN